MDAREFETSLSSANPPAELSPLLLALWHSGRGEWDRAHEIAQEIHSADGSWVHAHLHRQEGDLGNAAYWYRRAGKPAAAESLADEWIALVEKFLNQADR